MSVRISCKCFFCKAIYPLKRKKQYKVLRAALGLGFLKTKNESEKYINILNMMEAQIWIPGMLPSVWHCTVFHGHGKIGMGENRKFWQTTLLSVVWFKIMPKAGIWWVLGFVVFWGFFFEDKEAYSSILFLFHQQSRWLVL